MNAEHASTYSTLVVQAFRPAEPFRPSGLVRRRANVAWKNASFGQGCRWPRRFSWLHGRRYQQSPAKVMRRHWGRQSGSTRIGCLRTRFTAAGVTWVRRAAARGRSPGMAQLRTCALRL